MELASRAMYQKGDSVYISRYEVIKAFLRTEEDEDEEMAKELNVLLNAFCEAERAAVRSIPVLPFDASIFEKAIEYIGTLVVEP